MELQAEREKKMNGSRKEMKNKKIALEINIPANLVIDNKMARILHKVIANAMAIRKCENAKRVLMKATGVYEMFVK